MEEENITPVERISPYDAGRILGSNAETVRAGLRQQRFPFGTAIPPENPGGKWTYIIIKSKFLEYVGIKKNLEVSTNEK